MFNNLKRFYSRIITNCSSIIRINGQCILCGDCGQQSLDMCPPCEQSLSIIKHCCRTCAMPLLNHSELLCGDCLQHPPPFTHTQAIWTYGFPVAQLIAAYKYQRKLSYGQTLGEIAIRHIEDAYSQRPAPDYIVATPLHWRRQLARGFNQTDMLARHYSNRLQTPLLSGVKRKKLTQPQQSLDARQRKVNLRDAFSIANPKPIKGKLVAVVDDVMTTGATAKELSQTLLDTGAREVHIWVLARTPH